MAAKEKSPFEMAKDLAVQAGERARTLVGENADKIDGVVDAAAGMIDDKTHGKYADKIGKVKEKARDVVDRLGTDVDAGPRDPSDGPSDEAGGGPGDTGGGPTG